MSNSVHHPQYYYYHYDDEGELEGFEAAGYDNLGDCSLSVRFVSFESQVVFHKVYNCIFVVCMLAVGVLYALIFRSVRQRRALRLSEPVNMVLTSSSTVDKKEPECVGADETEGAEVEGEDAYNSERMRRANIKTAAMLFVVALVFLLTYLPALVMSLLHRVNPILFYFYLANHAVNPIIYGAMNRPFRRMAFRVT